MDENDNVLETIKVKYNKIYKAERKVADFILEHPRDAMNSNVAELAKSSGVSDATVIRMCHHLGFNGYYQFRLLLAKNVGNDDKSNENNESLNEPNAVQKVFQEYANSITTTGENIDEDVMRNCVDLIKNCRQAYVIAVGNTIPLAMYMSFRLMRLGVQCTTDLGPEYYLNHINLASKDDIVIAISQSGSSKYVIQGVELAKKKKMKVIAITAYAESEVSEIADYSLFSTGRKESFNYYKNYSHLRETAVIDALLEFVTNRDRMEKNQTDVPEMILAETKY